MIAFLATFGLAALLVVVDVRASLRLRVPDMPLGRRLSGLRRSYSAPMAYTTASTESRQWVSTSQAATVTPLLLCQTSMLDVLPTQYRLPGAPGVPANGL